MAGEGTSADAVEGLRLARPGYFADPASAPPMPELDLSVDCHSQTFDSIHQHLDRGTLMNALPLVTLPVAFILGTQSPIPPIHGYRTANLIPGAVVHQIEDCGHMVWMKQPGATMRSLRQLAGL